MRSVLAEESPATVKAERDQLRAEVAALRAAFLPRSAERDLQIRLRLEWFADGYRAGFAAGRDVGYGQADAELDRAWRAAARRLARGGPSHDELRRRRYGTGA